MKIWPVFGHVIVFGAYTQLRLIWTVTELWRFIFLFILPSRVYCTFCWRSKLLFCMTTKNIDLKLRGGSKKPTLFTLDGLFIVEWDLNTIIIQYIWEQILQGYIFIYIYLVVNSWSIMYQRKRYDFSLSCGSFYEHWAILESQQIVTALWNVS
jgi:hypothetical protein